MKKHLLYLFIFLLAGAVHAQPGILDQSFGNGGVLVSHINQRGDDLAYASERTSDGKIIMAGESMQGCGSAISVLRMLDNGMIDSTFGVHGYTLVMPTPFQNTAYDIAIQQDAKIVLAGRSFGTSQSYFTIVRLTEYGQLDNTFGVNGVQLIQMGGSFYDAAKAVSVQSDGKLVISGIEAVGNDVRQYTVIRLLANGSMDESFGTNGKASYDVGSDYTWNSCNNSVIQPDGKIVVVGSSTPYGYSKNSILRINPDGSLDLSFNGTGFKVFYISVCNNSIYDVVITADNKILLAAEAYNISSRNNSIGLIRLLPDGSFDPSFGNGAGYVNPEAISGFVTQSMEIASTGHILVAGYKSLSEIAAYRFFADGQLDMSYGQSGVAIKDITPWTNSLTGAFCSAINESDELFLIGNSWGGELSHIDFTCCKFNRFGYNVTGFGNNGLFMKNMGSAGEMQKKIVPLADGGFLSLGKSIAKFNEDGTLDNTFSITSNALFDPMDCVIQPDNKIVIAGGKKADVYSSYDFAVLRLNADGTPDHTFGVDGFFINSFGSAMDVAYSVALQTDGKIVAVGGGDIITDQGFIAIRLTTSGTPDASFDTDGILVLKMNNTSCANTVCIQSDGKILIGGYTRKYNYSGYYSAVLRLENNGSYDYSFGANGLALRMFNGGSQVSVIKLALQPDGKILAAGGVTVGNTGMPLLMRYNTDGSEDLTFNGDGKIILTDYSTYSLAHDVQVQADGKILLLGVVYNPANTLSDLFLHRFHSTGLVDDDFASDGKFYYASLSSAANSFFRSSSMELGTDGKILVSHYSGCKLLLLRLLNDNNPQLHLSDVEKNYGDNPFSCAFTSNSNGSVQYEVVSGNAVTINASGEATIRKAGTAKIKIIQSADGQLSSGSAYATVTVNPAVLTVTAEDKYKMAGDENPVLTYTYSGFVYNENAEVLSGAPAIMAAANESSPAGIYRIVPVKNTLHADNYVFNLVEGKLTVDLATAVDGNTMHNGIHVFPNPSVGRLFIKADENIDEICLTNVVGQQEFFYITEFNTSMKGMVIVRVKTAAGFSYTKIVLE